MHAHQTMPNHKLAALEKFATSFFYSEKECVVNICIWRLTINCTPNCHTVFADDHQLFAHTQSITAFALISGWSTHNSDKSGMQMHRALQWYLPCNNYYVEFMMMAGIQSFPNHIHWRMLTDQHRDYIFRCWNTAVFITALIMSHRVTKCPRCYTRVKLRFLLD